MKGNMLIVVPLCLLLCWMLPVGSMTIRLNFSLRNANDNIPLSMVENSVDDMYLGCNEAMMKLVKYKYFEEEKNQFSEAWNVAKDCAELKFKQREDEALTKDHLQAICLYTSNNVYQEFNEAVRTKGSIYSSSFQFKSLHYLLTSAIQILNNNYYCRTSYRRLRVKFTDEVNQIIRFGSFASSSDKTDLKIFGNETCFKIKTCLGASLKDYSIYGKEAEVLIPPYEAFNITQKLYKGNPNLSLSGLEDCEVVFVLESAGGKSNLNCNIYKRHV